MRPHTIPISRLVVHHSASPIDKTTVRDIEDWHVRDNGWDAIGYHFVIGNGDGMADLVFSGACNLVAFAGGGAGEVVDLLGMLDGLCGFGSVEVRIASPFVIATVPPDFGFYTSRVGVYDAASTAMQWSESFESSAGPTVLGRVRGQGTAAAPYELWISERKDDTGDRLVRLAWDGSGFARTPFDLPLSHFLAVGETTDGRTWVLGRDEWTSPDYAVLLDDPGSDSASDALPDGLSPVPGSMNDYGAATSELLGFRGDTGRVLVRVDWCEG